MRYFKGDPNCRICLGDGYLSWVCVPCRGLGKIDGEECSKCRGAGTCPAACEDCFDYDEQINEMWSDEGIGGIHE